MRLRYIVAFMVATLVAVIFVVACGTWPGRRSERILPQYTQDGWKSVKIVGGGYIPGVVYNTAREGLAYARTDIGGAYRWNPENRSWIPLTDFVGAEDWGYLGINSIATDSVEPNRLIISAGMYTNDWDPNNGAFFVSEDYGDSFVRVDMPFKKGGNMPGRGVGERLAIDPNDNSIVYFGSFGDGLWRSTDFGHTWSEVRSFPTRGNVYDADFAEYQDGHRFFYGIMWVVFDPSSGTHGNATRNIYVGVADTGNTIFESRDGGETWHPLAGQPSWEIRPGMGSHAHRNNGECDIDHFFPLQGRLSPDGSLVIAYNQGFGPYSSSRHGGAIWRFTFATGQWEDISLPQRDFEDGLRHLSRGVGSVAVDWRNPNVLVASTMNEWWPDEIIFRSTNGGKSWDPIWFIDGWPNRVNRYGMDARVAPWLDWGATAEHPEESPKLGWMITALVINPFNSDEMMYGTGATLYGTRNLTNWDRGRRVAIEVMAEGIEETAILDIAVPSSGPVELLSGMGDIGGFAHTNLNLASAMIVNPTIAGVNSVDFAALDPSFMVRMGDGELGISRDWGRTWKSPANYFQPPAEIGAAGWNGVIAVSADARVIVWSPINTAPHWTDNDGVTWTQSSGLPAGVKVRPDRVNPARFYAFGTPVGGKPTVWASDDSARTFRVISTGFVVGDATSADFRTPLGEEGHMWIATGEAGIYFSTDGGSTFERLPNIDRADIIGFGKGTPGASYQSLFTTARISGQWGIWRSDDMGRTWTRINDDTEQFGMATVITGSPRVHGRVFVGTNGRGILWRDLD